MGSKVNVTDNIFCNGGFLTIPDMQTPFIATKLRAHLDHFVQFLTGADPKVVGCDQGCDVSCLKAEPPWGEMPMVMG